MMRVTMPPAAASWAALGTVAALAVTEPALLPAARELLAAEIAAADAACSTFRDDSELAAVNAAAGRGAPVRISPLLAEAVGAALLAAELTGGDVDPVGWPGTAAAIWPSLPAGPRARLAVTASASWRQLRLDTGRGLVTLPAGSWLDLGATTKAWAADRAATMIAARLGGGVLVSLGGDVAASGDRPPGGWRVRLQDNSVRLAGQPELPATVVSIRGGGLATAGAGAARWRHGGEILTQILSPRQGALAAPPWRLASVTAATCLRARAASIAAIIKGDEAASWLAGLGLPARLVDAAGRVRTIAAWPADPAGPPASPRPLSTPATPPAGPAGASQLAGTGGRAPLR